MIVFLVGYMGCGKSVIGSKLAEILKYDFIDLDDFITEKEGDSIKNIFQLNGEIYFRKVETLYLKQVLNFDNTVVSLGGGTPCYGNNMDLILSSTNAMTIYLKTSISVLANRLSGETTKRPIISHLVSDTELKEFIGKHIFERAPYYEQCGYIIKTDQLSVDAVVSNLLIELF